MLGYDTSRFPQGTVINAGAAGLSIPRPVNAIVEHALALYISLSDSVPSYALIGGGGGLNASFVLDPDSTDPDVFTNIDDLAAAVALVPGRKTVTIQNSSGSGTVAIPNGVDGPYDFASCNFVVDTTYLPAGSITVTFGTGCAVTPTGFPYGFQGANAIIRLPASFWTPSVAFNVFILDGCTLDDVPGVTAAASIVVGASILVFPILQNGAGLGGDPTATAGIFSINATGAVAPTLYDGASVVSAYVATGAGIFSVACRGSQQTVKAQTLAAWLGTQAFATQTSDKVVYDPAGLISDGNVFDNWTNAYLAALGQPGQAEIEVVGNTGTIPAGTWDLSQIVLSGAPGSQIAQLNVAQGADLTSSTKIELAGSLVLAVAANVTTSPMVLTSGTVGRIIRIRDSAYIWNRSTAPVPFLTTSGTYTGLLSIMAEGNENLPICADVGGFLTIGSACTVMQTGNRANQSPVIATAGVRRATFSVTLNGTQTGATTVDLLDGFAGATGIKIPQFSSALVTGTIIVRGTTAGTTNTAAYTIDPTVVTRGAAANTTAVAAGGTTTEIYDGATTFPAPVLAADTTNGALLVSCTGIAAVTGIWTAHLEVTLSGTGA